MHSHGINTMKTSPVVPEGLLIQAGYLVSIIQVREDGHPVTNPGSQPMTLFVQSSECMGSASLVQG